LEYSKDPKALFMPYTQKDISRAINKWKNDIKVSSVPQSHCCNNVMKEGTEKQIWTGL
jgi:hypothetical protein